MNVTAPDSSLFNDGKDAQALRTIGEVAKAFGLRAHVLRYWEEQFPALQPIKRSGNRRYYRPEDVALIGQIDRLVHREGYTLKGAARAIEGGNQGRSAGEGAKDGPSENPQVAVAASCDDALFARLTAIRDDLAKALTQG